MSVKITCVAKDVLIYQDHTTVLVRKATTYKVMDTVKQRVCVRVLLLSVTKYPVGKKCLMIPTVVIRSCKSKKDLIILVKSKRTKTNNGQQSTCRKLKIEQHELKNSCSEP